MGSLSGTISKNESPRTWEDSYLNCTQMDGCSGCSIIKLTYRLVLDKCARASSEG